MRVRSVVRLKKSKVNDSGGWSRKELPPRWCPVFSKKKPMAGDWHWRAIKASAANREFVVVAQCSPNRGNWKAFLIEKLEDEHSVVARFEDHGGHPGVHVHSHCARSGIDVGPTTLDGLGRIPPAGSFHRRVYGHTLQSFWDSAMSFFNVVENGETQLGQTYGLF